MFLIYSLVFLIVNFFWGLYLFNNPSYLFENEYFTFSISIEEFLLYFLIYIIFIVYLYTTSKIIDGKPNKTILKIDPKIWNALFYTMLSFSIFGILINYIFSINIAGKPNPEDVPLMIKALSILSNVDYMIPLFLCLRFLNFKKYIFISFICIIGFILRGWMGGLFIVVLCWAINYRNYHSIWPSKTKKYALLLFAGILILLPVLFFLKYYFRTAGPEESLLDLIVQYFLANDLTDIYNASFISLLQRLLTIDSYSIFFDNYNNVANAYENGRITPFYADNMIWSALNKTSDQIPLGQFLASLYLGGNLQWAVHPTFPILLWLGGFGFFVFSIMISIFCIKFATSFPGKGVLDLVLVMSIMFLWHGWISAYVNVFLYLIYLHFMILCFSISHKKSANA